MNSLCPYAFPLVIDFGDVQVDQHRLSEPGDNAECMNVAS